MKKSEESFLAPRVSSASDIAYGAEKKAGPRDIGRNKRWKPAKYEIKKSEELLGRSQIFANGQTGPRPSIVVRPSTTEQLDRFADKAPSNSQH